MSITPCYLQTVGQRWFKHGSLLSGNLCPSRVNSQCKSTAKGLIRWLRPEYQAPEYKAPVTQTLDLGEAAVVLPDNVIPWPASLPEQVSAVQGILAASQSPLAPQDVARAFKGKRAASVRPVLDALTGIGMARRLKDGRYAA
jgi:hypothetical protein